MLAEAFVFCAERGGDQDGGDFCEGAMAGVTAILGEDEAEGMARAVNKLRAFWWVGSEFRWEWSVAESEENSDSADGDSAGRSAQKAEEGCGCSARDHLAARLVIFRVSLSPKRSGRYISSTFVAGAVTVPAVRTRAR